MEKYNFGPNFDRNLEEKLKDIVQQFCNGEGIDNSEISFAQKVSEMKTVVVTEMESIVEEYVSRSEIRPDDDDVPVQEAM